MKYEKYSFINENNLQDFEKLHNKKLKDPYNDQYHLSSYSGLINDPNGLIYHEGTYYIYMQNTPYSDDHKNKSWLLYATKDFANYIYEGIVLTPSCEFDKHGVFSGGAFVNENSEIDLYYTGNIKDENNKRMNNTLIANVDFKNKKVNKKLLFQTNLSLYTGEFRDPNIVKKGKNIFMLNGAQNNDKKGV